MGNHKWKGGILNFNIKDKSIIVFRILFIKNKLFIIIE